MRVWGRELGGPNNVLFSMDIYKSIEGICDKYLWSKILCIISQDFICIILENLQNYSVYFITLQNNLFFKIIK